MAEPETPAAELAAYVLWSATVDPAGFLTRPAVLMSKHWMDKVWSWDHCFNALALAAGEPDLAWHQFHVPFDHQDPSGALPDSVAHSEVLHNYVKPPIHGWALRHLRRWMPAPPDAAELATTYDRLARWTTFWLDARRVPGHDLPHYQHGNDSGWDNATTFDGDRVIETADLAAFLVIQLRQLADLAVGLGRPEAAQRWTGTAERVRAAMLDQALDRRAVHRPWRRHRPGSARHQPARPHADHPRRRPARRRQRRARPARRDPPDRARAGHRARRLPALHRRRLLARPHLGTVLIQDGLRRAGHVAPADEISHRFRTLCEKSGFAENFDAETGTGLRDRAYTWTAGSYLILAAAHEHRRSGPPAG